MYEEIKDKNGTEIKPGDKVKFENGSVAVVIWSEDQERLYFDFNGNQFESYFYAWLHDDFVIIDS